MPPSEGKNRPERVHKCLITSKISPKIQQGPPIVPLRNTLNTQGIISDITFIDSFTLDFLNLP